MTEASRSRRDSSSVDEQQHVIFRRRFTGLWTAGVFPSAWFVEWRHQWRLPSDSCHGFAERWCYTVLCLSGAFCLSS